MSIDCTYVFKLSMLSTGYRYFSLNFETFCIGVQSLVVKPDHAYLILPNTERQNRVPNLVYPCQLTLVQKKPILSHRKFCVGPSIHIQMNELEPLVGLPCDLSSRSAWLVKVFKGRYKIKLQAEERVPSC